MTLTLDAQAVLIDGTLARHPNVVYPADEVCAEPRCDAVLSIYNPTIWCALHEGCATRALPIGDRRGLRKQVRQAAA